jgi:hypothetical protein
MKTLLCVCAALVMALGTARLHAADVTGSWTGDFATPDGNSFQLEFTFKQDGAVLTGSIQGPEGDPLAISEGKVDGNKLSFKIEFNGTTISHEGTINDSGDEIKLSSKSDSGDFPGAQMTLKRAKAPAAAPAPAPAPQL